MSAIDIYTSNTCLNSRNGGWAFLSIEPDGKGQFETSCSGDEQNTNNNRLELLAVINALEWHRNKTNINIHTKSVYVIKGMTEWIEKWKRHQFKNVKNPDLWKRLDKLCQNRKIVWKYLSDKYIKNNIYTEQVDKLSRIEAKKV